MEKDVYSIDGNEEWKELTDIMDELAEFAAPGEEITIFCGDSVPVKHIDLVNADLIIEAMQNDIYDKSGEFAEDYTDALGELETEGLKKVIAEWLDKNTTAPDWYTVENVVEYPVVVGEEL